LTPFSDGFKAFVAGKPQKSNPYPRQHRHWMRWDGGWIAAQRDAQRQAAKQQQKEMAK
jgi:ribosome modulation factor